MDRKNVKLLIVDDEKGFANVLRKRMKHRGILAATASRGSEAVRMVHENSFDAVILDLKLEGMNGIEILKVLKLISPDLPVLMLTGHGCEKAAAASVRMGAEDYLAKPMDFDLLLDRVLQVCSREKPS